jgi:hypothetical protein
MLLRVLDALGENDRYIERFSTIATVSPTPGAAAIFSAFAGTKSSGPRKRDLPIVNASFSIAGLSARLPQPVAHADDGEGMLPFDRNHRACL